MDPQELQNSNYVLIRHGLSEFNLASLIARIKYGRESEEFIKVNKDRSLIDPPLHPIGIMQSESHQDVVNAIDWKIVYVSPMRRAMMTAINMYCNHPNKDNINFVVLPIVREIIHT